MTDPIADLLIRIKNGYMARRQKITVPHSNVKEALVKLLHKYGYVGEVTYTKGDALISIALLYADGVPALTEVKRLSRPGLRRYIRAKDLKSIRQGLGYVILSTPQGLKTHIEAKKIGIGGEVLCTIW